jgi:hypothetical protein
MTKEERQDVVLRFMAEHGLALPPRLVYRNLKVTEGITFGPRTVENYIREFEKDGLVARVDPSALDEGDVETLDTHENGRRAYYMITEDGRDRILSE